MHPNLIAMALMVSITALATILSISVWLKRRDDARRWEIRLNYYRELVLSISDIVLGSESIDGEKRWAYYCNVAPLYMPPDALYSLYAFRAATNRNAPVELRLQADQLLTILLDDIRRDLGIPGALAKNGIEIQLWSITRQGNRLEV